MSKNKKRNLDLVDNGPSPFVTNIKEDAIANKNFRTTLWTGEYLQLTLMSIKEKGEIGLERHDDFDQFLRIEEGEGVVFIGDDKDDFQVKEKISRNSAIFVPAGKWHNLINTGKNSLKFYSIYAPPAHPTGTVHETKEDSDNAHNH